MTKHTRDHSLGEGVYYAAPDYAGIERRVVLLVVDLAVIILAGIGLALATPYGAVPELALWGMFVVLVWLYLTVVKASNVRTLGYWVAGTKIVTLRGKRPSFLRMTFRLLLWIGGPFSFIFDLIWAGIDQDCQTIRDRFAGTCVVLKNAEPVGPGEIHLAYFGAGGCTLVYPHVTPRRPHTEGAADFGQTATPTSAGATDK